MNRKYTALGPLAAALALALVAWVVLPVPLVHAEDSNIGAWYVGDDPPGGARGDDGGSGDPGWQADPDTFQIDLWSGARTVRVEEPAPPSGTFPGSGIVGWLVGWLLGLFGHLVAR